MAYLRLPGLAPGLEAGNAAALIFAALHYVSEADQLPGFHAFMRDHLGAAGDDAMPPAEVLRYLCMQVQAGVVLTAAEAN
jgi:hypothetical protein